MKLSDLRAIAEAASKGPWAYRHTAPAFPSQVLDRNGGILFNTSHHGRMREDAEHAATFDPVAVMKLLAVVEAAKTFYLSRALLENQREVDWDAFETLGKALRELEATE